VSEAQKIVCMENVHRYYGDNPELVAKYVEFVESGKCPFCAPNIKNQLVGTTAYWRIVENQYPYKHVDGTVVRLHLLLLPKRHVVTLEELSLEEWADLFRAISAATERFPFLADGFGLAVRVGEIGGVTLNHLHPHLIAPALGESGQKPVSFGIG
jgi:diadenosine tetraphosphate (Ap4A) HIT family hydrolase